MQRVFLCAAALVATLLAAATSSPVHARDAADPYTLSLAVQPGADRLDNAGRAAERDRRAPAFSEGSWTVESLGFALTDVSRGARADLYGGAVGFSYYFADDVAVRGELIGLTSNQTGDNAHGGGASVHGRWHFYRREGFTAFFEGGGGVLQTTVSLPDGDRAEGQNGTHFNFTATTALGVTFQLADRLHLNTAVRYVHVSNARRRGGSRNPSTEGVGGQIGLIWAF